MPRTWEVLYSCPPPRPSIYETDPRILKAHGDLTLWEKIAPEYLTMHENGGDVPQECIFITAHEFGAGREHSTGADLVRARESADELRARDVLDWLDRYLGPVKTS